MTTVDIFAGLNAILVAKILFLGVGSVELVRSAFDNNWRTFATILVSALICGIAGLSLDGIGFLAGVLIGLTASGVITTAQNVGSK